MEISRRINQQIAITKFIALPQQQITEESLQINRSIVNTFHNILIVGTDKRIAEIPRVAIESNFI